MTTMLHSSEMAALTVWLTCIAQGCATYEPPSGNPMVESATDTATRRALAVLTPMEGHRAHGTVAFVEQPDGSVRITGRMTGLFPGLHGFHIHESGDCRALDPSSSGRLFRPDDDRDNSAGDPLQEHRAGDLGNVFANSLGVVDMDGLYGGLGLYGAGSIIGRTVIVHAGAGNAGESGIRVACGLIKLAAQ